MAVNLKTNVPAFQFNVPIVDPATGFPSQQFIQLWQDLTRNTEGLGEDVPADLSDLDNVKAGSPADGEALVWSDSDKAWVASASSGGMSHQQVMARVSIGV